MADADHIIEQSEYKPSNKQAIYERHVLCPHTKTIRVLDVRPIPADATEGTPLECTLRVVDLDDDPAFTALSYVWGDPTPTHRITCDGVVFGVGENCYSALWHLSKKLQGLVIWVDAICIDQEDLRKEKAWQIPLMGDIYTKAEQVYIWLGKSDERSNRVMRYLAEGGMKRYVKVLPDGKPQYRPFMAVLYIGLATWSFTNHPDPFRGNNKPLLARFTRRMQYVSWSDLVYVFDRPWKDRLWTYQEILLASYPVIVCGTEHVQWSDLEWTLLSMRVLCRYFPRAALAWETIVFDKGNLQSINRPADRSVLHTLQEHETIVKSFISTRKWSLITFSGILLTYTTISLIVAVVSICARTYPRWGVQFQLKADGVFMLIGSFGTFFCLIFIWVAVTPTGEYQTYRGDIKEATSDDLVGALYQRAATDPRDMAYGIWAVLRKRGASDLPAPNYDVAKEKQIPLLYWQLTIHLIRTTKNLRFLHIAAARRMPGTPSWIPDWSSFGSNTWKDVVGFPGTDFHGRAASPEGEERLRKHRALQKSSLDSTQSVLTVLARETGVVHGCVSFYLTTVTSLETDEKHAHLENLRSMRQWADWAKAIGCTICAISYTQPVQPFIKFAPISAEAPWPSQRDRTSWGKILSGSRRDSLEEYLNLWMNDTKVPKWFRKFMATQICLCNLLAELERNICYVSSSVNPGRFLLLSCWDKTKVDDRALLVCGLPGWIVVRKRSGIEDGVEIISPVVSQGSGLVDRPINMINGGDTTLDDLFVEYHIH